jgi:elongation factor G
MVLRKVDDREPLALYVFKTMSDPFAGRISFFKVFSGVAKTDATINNYTHRSTERLAHLTVMQGRTAMPIAELHAGDIGAVAKLRETFTGDTLGDAGHEIYFDPVTMPEPAVTYAMMRLTNFCWPARDSPISSPSCRSYAAVTTPK